MRRVWMRTAHATDASRPLQVRSAAALCLARLLSRPDMEQRGGELAAFLEWAAATLAVCTAPPGSADHVSLPFAGAGLRDGEEPARPASVASAAAASFAQQQAASSVGDGDSGTGSIASRAFLAAGVMQVGGEACPLRVLPTLLSLTDLQPLILLLVLLVLLLLLMLMLMLLLLLLLLLPRPSSTSQSTATGASSSVRVLRTSFRAS